VPGTSAAHHCVGLSVGRHRCQGTICLAVHTSTMLAHPVAAQTTCGGVCVCVCLQQVQPAQAVELIRLSMWPGSSTVTCCCVAAATSSAPLPDHHQQLLLLLMMMHGLRPAECAALQAVPPLWGVLFPLEEAEAQHPACAGSLRAWAWLVWRVIDPKTFISAPGGV
jgi:hypothetical protein